MGQREGSLDGVVEALPLVVLTCAVHTGMIFYRL